MDENTKVLNLDSIRDRIEKTIQVKGIMRSGSRLPYQDGRETVTITFDRPIDKTSFIEFCSVSKETKYYADALKAYGLPHNWWEPYIEIEEQEEISNIWSFTYIAPYLD